MSVSSVVQLCLESSRCCRCLLEKWMNKRTRGPGPCPSFQSAPHLLFGDGSLDLDSPPSCQHSLCSVPSQSEAQSWFWWLVCSGCCVSRVPCPHPPALPQDRGCVHTSRPVLLPALVRLDLLSIGLSRDPGAWGSAALPACSCPAQREAPNPSYGR